jgi:Tfp pilus assembly protein PilF
MSLVSELLARVKHREEKRDVPPTLREDILQSLQRRRARRKWLLSVAITLMVIGAGVGLVLWFQSEQASVSLLARSSTPTAGPVAPPGAASNPGAGPASPAQPSELPTQQPGPSSAPPSSASVPALPSGPPLAPPSPAPVGTPSGSPPVPTMPADPAAIAPHGAASQTIEIKSPRRGAKSPSLAAGSSATRVQSGTDMAAERQGTEPAIVESAAEGDRVKAKESGPENAPDVAEAKEKSTQAAKEAVPGGREGQAKPHVQSAPVRTPKWDRDVYLYQASTSEAAGDFKQALASYRKVLSVEPKNYVVLNNVVGLLVRLGSYDEAIGYAEKALAVKPNHVPSLVNMSIAYLQKGNRAAGEDCLRRALAVEPSNPLALKTLAVLLEKENVLDGAREVFAKLAHTGDVQGYLGMARVAEKQGKTEEAIKAYQAVLLLDRVEPKDRALASDRVYQLTR